MRVKSAANNKQSSTDKLFKKTKMIKTLTLLFFCFLFFLFGCGQSKTIAPETIDNIELVQVKHPFLGEKIKSTKLDKKFIPEFLVDFADKKEEIIKFYSCYVIKIHLKNGTLISYRTNGINFEKMLDDNTAGVYFKLKKEENLITKYWQISKADFCDTVETKKGI
jgi:hypothetical protein